MIRHSLRRGVSAWLALATTACYSWQPGPALSPDPGRAAAQMRGVVDSLGRGAPPGFDGALVRAGQRRLRMLLRDGTRVELLTPSIERDSLVGIQEVPYGRRSVALSDVAGIELFRVNETGQLLLLAAGLGVGVGVGWIIGSALAPDFGRER